MIIIAPNTVLNPAALETRSVPRRFFGRAMVFPRNFGRGDFWRLVFEVQPLRYFLALVPFIIAMMIWPHLALPIAQAPLFMLIAIWFVEMRMLRVRDEARPLLLDEDAAARFLDALRFRATTILRDIAAARDLRDGQLFLVIEQSELARIRPLTLVSVQTEGPAPALLPLDAREQALIRDTLFDDAFSERDLQAANLREDEALRMVGFDARGVSAHARLAARLATRQGVPA